MLVFIKKRPKTKKQLNNSFKIILIKLNYSQQCKKAKLKKIKKK